MNRSQLVSWVLIGVSVCGGAVAAETLPSGMRACMSESDAGKRLACFDRESARLSNESAPAARQAATPAPPVPTPPAAASATAAPAAASTAAAAAEKSPQEKFGYRGNIARADVDQKAEEERRAAEQLKATITELSTLAHGELVLTLDNGQVWQQKTSDRALRLKVGDQVTIKRGSLASFLLTSEAKGAKGSMRVTRVK